MSAEKKPAEQESNCCSCLCCCSCCKPEENPLPEHLRDGDITSNRSCTDCPMIIVYGLFLIGWIIILAIAAAQGKPDRILLPENYRGDLCGEGRLTDMPNIWIPLPNRPKYGLCVPERCPSLGSVVCNNDVEPQLGNKSNMVPNSYYTHNATQFKDGLVANTLCKASCNAEQQAASDRYTGLQIKMQEKKCFWAFYPSKPSLFRCIPSLSKDDAPVNQSMAALANQTAGAVKELGNVLGVGSFFMLGFAELQQCWPVILISAATCMGIAVVWVVLLRWILAPVVYFCVILILALLVVLGFIFKFFADDLADGALPGETGTENQETLWRVAEYVSWLLAAMYFVVMLYMLKRIRIAIAVMDEASKAFMSAPSLIFIPILTFIVFVGWIAFFIATSIYIQTMGRITNDTIINQAASLFGSDAKNITDLLKGSKLLNSSYNGTGASNPTFNISTWNTDTQTKVLHLYNFFGVLWTGNFCIMLGFFIMAMTVCSWYFSATQTQMRLAEEGAQEGGKNKAAPNGILLKSLTSTLWYHMGTVLWGALCIAIIQFVRAIFTYLSENYLKDVDSSTMAKIVVRCIECCLWYIEHVVRVISKNAFIICVIRSTNFCSSAAETLVVLVANAARISILTMLSTATIFLVKGFIVGCNILIAWGLLHVGGLTKDKPVESGLFPIFLITLISFGIASLFLNVYEACIDTIFMSFLMDEKHFKGEFMPTSLAKIVDLFKGAEEARLQYEKQMNSAMVGATEAAAHSQTPKPDAGKVQ